MSIYTYKNLQKCISISKKQYKRINRIIDMLDITKEWDKIQNEFDKINSEIIKLEPNIQRDMIDVIVNNLVISLIENGCNITDVNLLSTTLVEHWLTIIDNRDNINLRDSYHRFLNEWTLFNKKFEEDLRQNGVDNTYTLKYFLGLAKIFTGGGAIAFDVIKLMTIMPIPNFVYTTIMGGAVLFYSGLEKVLCK